MKYLHLIWAALFRSKTRTLLTLLSVVTAFLLFGLLDSVRVAFNSGGSVSGANRMVVASRLSITQMLPYSLQSQIATVPGVKHTAYAAWFGGIYRDPKNFFPNFSVSPEYLDMYPEYELPPAQRKAFDADRQGAIVGAALAERNGWKVGDTIPLQATIFPTRGSNNWEFKLRGIYTLQDAKRKNEENQLWFHWTYFDEANDYVKGRVGWYVIQVDDPAHADRVARAVDALSQNSDHETKTQTEQAFNQAFAKQFADIGLIVTAIMAAVFFTLLLLTGNTMAQAVRERIPELAVLKTIGFSNASVLWLVLAESILLIMLGGVLGMGAVARARPDGLTLLLGTIATFSLAPLALKNPGFHPLEDFAHLSMVTDNVYVLCANPKWNSLGEILAAAKQDPGKIAYASWGIGTTAHLPMVDLAQRAGVELTHVPYNGSPPALIDTIAGRTDMMFALLAACKGHIESGRLRPLATCGLERAHLLPELPTMPELGYAGFRVGGWYGVSVPKDTPAAIQQQVLAATTAMVTAPEARRVLDPQGMFMLPLGPAAMVGRIREELALHATLFRAAGITPE